MTGYDEKGIEDLKNRLIRWSVVAPQDVKKVLQRGAEMVRREAQTKHFRLPKMPTGEGDPTNAWLGSSEPRHPWRLRRSIAIRVTVKPGEISAQVGTSVPYGRVHELGLPNERGIKMPARPFLKPSLAMKHNEVFEMIDKAWFNAYGK